MTSQNQVKCPCGSSSSYESCCKTIHNDITRAKTAEQLMRSRYTAFTLAMGDYLLESHHKTTRPNKEMKTIVSWAKSVKWQKLEIINGIQGQENDIFGTVEFKAHYLSGNKPDFILENSKFVKEYGVWYYLGRIEE